MVPPFYAVLSRRCDDTYRRVLPPFAICCIMYNCVKGLPDAVTFNQTAQHAHLQACSSRLHKCNIGASKMGWIHSEQFTNYPSEIALHKPILLNVPIPTSLPSYMRTPLPLCTLPRWLNTLGIMRVPKIIETKTVGELRLQRPALGQNWAANGLIGN